MPPQLFSNSEMHIWMPLSATLRSPISPPRFRLRRALLNGPIPGPQRTAAPLSMSPTLPFTAGKDPMSSL